MANRQDLISQSRKYSRCTISVDNHNSTRHQQTSQQGCLCIAKYPFAPEPIQNKDDGDYVILSVRKLYSKKDDFAVSKWTVSFGTKADSVVVELVPTNIVCVITCCTSNEHLYGSSCRCEANFSVVVLHHQFSEKLRVQIELKTGNRQFVPLSICDVTNPQIFLSSYKQAFVRKKFRKAVLLEGYYAIECGDKCTMFEEKVMAYTESIKNSVSNVGYSSSGSAILDDSLSYVCGVHNVIQPGSTVSLKTSYITIGTSVFQIASQLIGKQ